MSVDIKFECFIEQTMELPLEAKEDPSYILWARVERFINRPNRVVMIYDHGAYKFYHIFFSLSLSPFIG